MSSPVFISYSTDDTPIAELIRDGLEAASIACWMAPRDIAPGLEYGSQIVAAIEECVVMVLLLSESSNRSRFVFNEVERAVSKDKIVIPVRIHDVQPSRSLEFFISNAQWIDAWQGSMEAHIVSLTTALHKQLIPGDAGSDDNPALGSTASPARRAQNNLPAQLTRFIGRERVIAETKVLLDNARLLTLTGIGGTGKTRLALEVGGAVTPNFVDGVWLVELAALAEGAMVAATIASTVGLPSSNQSAITMLTHYLYDKQLLLILDNCEHLIDTCAEVAETLLHACPDLHILATSREALGVAGELTWPVPSLQMPEPAATLAPAELATYEAVGLFLDRASLVSPGFALTAANAEAVRQICARLDGIPLAIELAAARVKTLSAQEVAARLGDRFRLLTGGSRTVLPRHQTLRALIDWSYRLLSESERILLRRLAVFAGGWTLEAAEGVCTGDDIDAWDVLDLLTRLVDKSLVVSGQQNTQGRYTLLETIRQYVVERLEDAEESAALRDRHFDYLLAFHERFAQQLNEDKVKDQVAEFNRLTLDLDNVRRAADWAGATGRIDDGLRLLHASGPLFILRAGQTELLSRFQDLIAQHGSASDARIHAGVCLAIASVYQRQAEFDRAREWLEKAEVLITPLGEPEMNFELLRLWIHDAIGRDDFSRAHSYLEQKQALAEGNDYFGRNKEIVESGLSGLYGQLLLAEGDYAQASQHFQLSHGVESKLGDIWMSTAVARFLGYALLYTGDVTGAADHLRESLLGNFSKGDKQAVAACLSAWAGFALVQGEFLQSARLFSASEALQEAIYTVLLPTDARQSERNIATLRQNLPPPELDVQWAAGRALTMGQAIDYALTSYPFEQK